MNDNNEHDPGDRPVGARAARLGLSHRDLFPDRQPAGDQGREGPRRCRSPQPRGRSGRRHARARSATAAIVLAETPAGARSRRRASPARSTSAARGSTISSSPPSARAIDRNSPPIRLFSPAGAPGAYFGEFGWIGRGRRAARTATRVWQASGDPADPGDAGHAELGQRPGPDLPDHPLGRRRPICSPPSRRVINRGAGAGRGPPLRAGQPGRPVARSRQLDRPCRADRRVQRRRRLRQRLQRRRRGRAAARSTAHGGWLGFTDKYWLAAVDPRPGRPGRGRASAIRASNSLPGRLSSRAPVASRRAAGRRAPSRTCSPAPRKSSCSTTIPTRSARRSSRRSTGAGSLVHEADLLAAELAVRPDRQFRRGDHLPRP